MSCRKSCLSSTVKDFWKKKNDTAFSEIDPENETSFEDTIESDEDFTEILNAEYTFDQIKKAMSELDEISKDVISLKFIEDKSYWEIAGILWISQDLVRQKCSRAIKALKVKFIRQQTFSYSILVMKIKSFIQN